MKLNIILLVIVILLIIYYCHKKYNEMEGYAYPQVSVSQCKSPVLLAGFGHCGSQGERNRTYQDMANRWCKLRGEGDKATSFTLPDGSYISPNATVLPRGFGRRSLCWLGGAGGNGPHSLPNPYKNTVPRKGPYGIGQPCKVLANLK